MYTKYFFVMKLYLQNLLIIVMLPYLGQHQWTTYIAGVLRFGKQGK